METQKPLVVEIKRNALDDGHGIRSVVFFKGCPLECSWCQNPEAISAVAEIFFASDRCVGCGACVGACKPKAISMSLPSRIIRESCNLCGDCVETCPSAALAWWGRFFGEDELARLLLLDEPFYRNSGGGVTLSGGEPLMWLSYAGKLLTLLKERNVHTIVETSGHFAWEQFEQHVLPFIDELYFDLKLAAPDQHRLHIGKDNFLIRRNFEAALASNAISVLPRIPLVPGITATRENLSAIAGYLQGFGVRKVALLPYNPLWLSKPASMARKPTYSRSTWMSAEELAQCSAVFADFELCKPG